MSVYQLIYPTTCVHAVASRADVTWNKVKERDCKSTSVFTYCKLVSYTYLVILFSNNFTSTTINKTMKKNQFVAMFEGKYLVSIQNALRGRKHSQNPFLCTLSQYNLSIKIL